MDEPSRSNPRRRRRAAGGGGVDLISGLSDDLLVRILDLVPDARDLVRTHGLSRQWRGLWTGVAALRFDFYSRRLDFSCRRMSCKSDADAERYIAFVNGALALRAAAKQPAFVEDLAISFDISGQKTEQLVPLSLEAAQGWIRYALQHEVKSFILKLKLPLRWQDDLDDRDDNDIRHAMISLDEIGTFAKMETMHLTLRGIQLRMPPSSVVFPSLTDLSLEGIKVPANGDYLLSRLVSSACCPHLHKHQLRHLSFELELSTMEVMLRIEAVELLKLSLESISGLQFLELRTPSLQVLCYNFLAFWAHQPLHIDVHGQLSSVGTLSIQMFSHGKYDVEDRNDGSIHLLQCCRLTRCLEVSFEIPKTKHQTIDIIKGRIPLLPDVTHLAVHIRLREWHSTGPGVACLLAQCINVKYLSLQLCYIITENLSQSDLLCNNESCHWKFHEFSLAYLLTVEFKELIGTDCEFKFIQSILTKATGIQKVIISFDRFYWPKGRNAFKLMPPLDGGLWTRCKGVKLSYKWRHYKWRRYL